MMNKMLTLTNMSKDSMYFGIIVCVEPREDILMSDKQNGEGDTKTGY